MTSDLAKFQKQFMRACINEEKISFSNIIPGGKLGSAEKVLEVHRNGYYARLTEALGETYAATWRVLGDEDFFDSCKEYISMNSSVSYDLGAYGDSFPSFVKERYLDEAPFLGDLARLELSFKKVFHERQHQPATQEEIFSLQSNPQLKISFGPSVKLVDLQFSVVELWRMRDEEDFQLDFSALSNSQCLVFYKNSESIYFQEITPAQFRVIQNLMDGISFEAALDDVEELTEEMTMELFSFLVQNGLIESISG